MKQKFGNGIRYLKIELPSPIEQGRRTKQMKILKNKFIKMKNINNKFKNKYKIQYSFFGIKLTIKNKAKIEFYKKKKEEEKEKQLKERYEIIKKELTELKEFRENKEYILTCYIYTYNHINSISKCIDSILEQKTKYDYLIKIIDDASTDGTTEVCLEYAKKYPEKIELTTVMHNSGGKTLTVAYENIETKYFSRIDGDDYWCDKNKIETALDFLEHHDEYIAYAHDTEMHNVVNNTSSSNVHDWEPNKNITNEISYDNFLYIHVSSRIHRNILDFRNKYKNIRKRDRVLWYLFLDAGKVYYEDKIMAVYNIGNTGFHSKKPKYFQALSRYLISYKMNKLFDYRYDTCFTRQTSSKTLFNIKALFGKRLGWNIWIFYMLRIKPIKFYYQALISEFKKVSKEIQDADIFTGDFTKKEYPTIERVREEMI